MSDANDEQCDFADSDASGAAEAAAAARVNSFHLIARVERVLQLDNWDCGVACCETVLRSRGRSEPTRDQLVEAIATQSAWTVDLALVLHTLCKVSCQLFTTQPSAQGAYSELEYYKNMLDNDKERVNAGFVRAAALGVPIHVRSVALPEILEWIGDDSLVIALVDARYLRCVCCDDERAMLADMLPSTELARRLAAPTEPQSLMQRLLFPIRPLPSSDDVRGYAGHYVTLCGFDRELQLLFIANPGKHQAELCAVTFEGFDRARKQFGTDEDLVRIGCER
jgi:hypothetical protein